MTTEPATADDDDLIWHYTSAEGLFGIIGNEEIYCSNNLFLNDANEYYSVLELIKKPLEDYRNNLKTNRLKAIERILTTFDYSVEKHKAIISAYVASFSEEKDLLSQWRGYCPNGGYSIGISKKELINTFNDGPYSLIKVQYINEDTYTDFFESEIKSFINKFEEVIGDEDFDLRPYMFPSQRMSMLLPSSDEKTQKLRSEQALKQGLDETDLGIDLNFISASNSPLYKDFSFSEEKEFRLFTINNADLSFRPQNGILKPYKKFPLTNTCIKKIVIGPNSNCEQCELGINIFLQNKGLDKQIKIEKSKVPYRTNH